MNLNVREALVWIAVTLAFMVVWAALRGDISEAATWAYTGVLVSWVAIIHVFIQALSEWQSDSEAPAEPVEADSA